MSFPSTFSRYDFFFQTVQLISFLFTFSLFSSKKKQKQTNKLFFVTIDFPSDCHIKRVRATDAKHKERQALCVVEMLLVLKKGGVVDRCLHGSNMSLVPI